MKKRIIALLIAVAVLFTFTACGKPKKPTAVDAVKNAFEAVKALDKDKLVEAFGTEGPSENFDDLDEATKTMLKLAVKNLAYNVISSEEKEETATVKTEITNTDMVKVLENAQSELVLKIISYMGEHNSEMPTDEETNAMLNEILAAYLEKDDLETVTKTEDLEFSLVDGKWQMQITADQFDTLFGGLYTFQQNLNQQ